MRRAIFWRYWVPHLTCRAFAVRRVVVCAWHWSVLLGPHPLLVARCKAKGFSSWKITCLISETIYIDLEVKLFLISLCTSSEAVGGFQGSACERAFRRSCPLTLRWGSEEFGKVMGVLVFPKAFFISFVAYVVYVSYVGELWGWEERQWVGGNVLS